MKVLQHGSLDTTGLKRAFDQVVTHLETGNFSAADVKKMTPGSLYRAKLSGADRLVFRFAEYDGETCLILLEIIRNHDYASSRFLRGAEVNEARLVPLSSSANLPDEDRLELPYVNPERGNVHILDKILSFDEDQERALAERPPLILIGSAGSGKTVLTLEKLRQLPGNVLYVTLSPYLVDNARDIYFAHNYENEEQEVDFLSFLEFVQSIAVPQGTMMGYKEFATWFSQARGAVPVRNLHALYEEFNGVLTGTSPSQPFLSREEYLELGIRRSIFPVQERSGIYDLFCRYLSYLDGSGFYDLNIVSFNHHALCKPTYDFIVADEVQDMTAVQLSLVLKSMLVPGQFVLCGDANQIVHPNFFSWAGVKTLFHEQSGHSHADIVRVLNTNYRNAPAVTAIANRLLRIKQARFGSIDRESHYLIRSVNERPGGVSIMEDTEANRRELDSKTSRSAKFAVIVLRDEDKAAAKRSFNTPLVFSVREAKGLEYEHIILPGLISGEPAAFSEIAAGVTPADLLEDYTYRRSRDKTDHSLDTYKFYVNAYYVALTRAISHVYILEHDASHPLLKLLQIKISKTAEVVEQESSDEEWRAEAQRLERQGKLDQVEDIRRNILRIVPITWEILTPAKVAEMTATELGDSVFRNDKTVRLITDFAAINSMPTVLNKFADAGRRRFQDMAVARTAALQRQGFEYQQPGYFDLIRKTNQHGVNFRNQFNYTPLMMAVSLGLPELVGKLVEKGASLADRDYWGRTPLQLALYSASVYTRYARSILPGIYDIVRPSAMNIRIGPRLVQLDSHRPAFMILNYMLAFLPEMLLKTKPEEKRLFDTAGIIAGMQEFPASVIPEHRCSRAAISAILSSNEIDRDQPGNRRLFVRMGHGEYLPNPCMEFEHEGVWTNILDLMDAPLLEHESTTVIQNSFLEYYRNLREEIAEKLKHAPGEMVKTAIQKEPAVSDGLPEFVKLAPMQHPEGYNGPLKPVTQYQVDRHTKTLKILKGGLSGRLQELEWFNTEPGYGAYCLLEFLESTVGKSYKTSTTKDNILLAWYAAALFLAEWREPRAFPLVIKILSSLSVFKWMIGVAEADISSANIAAILAATCDGNLSQLFGLLASHKKKDIYNFDVVTVVISMLLQHRKMDKEVGCRIFAELLANTVKLPNSWTRKPLILGDLAEKISLHFPAEFRGKLEELMRAGLIRRYSLTLSELKHRATVQPWELAHIRSEDMDALPQSALKNLELDAEENQRVTRYYNRFDSRKTGFPEHEPDHFAGDDWWDDEDLDPLSSNVTEKKPARNAPCPCGSGRKYKKCCGAV